MPATLEVGTQFSATLNHSNFKIPNLNRLIALASSLFQCSSLADREERFGMQHRPAVFNFRLTKGMARFI